MAQNSLNEANSDEKYRNNKDEGEDESAIELALESLNLGPKKKLLVFSLNGLLIHRAHRFDESNVPKNRRLDGVYRNGIRLVYKRPYLDVFMKFCLERFEVGLWSCAQEHNIDGVLDCAFKDVKSKLLFVWDHEKCTDSGFISLEKKGKPLFLKDLSKLLSNLAHSSLEPRFSESNVLIIDDKPEKALLNPPNTAIILKTYDANDATDDVLDPKKELGLYLEGLAEAEDVPSYVKEHSFGEPAIGPQHPNWDFYSQVLGHIKA